MAILFADGFNAYVSTASAGTGGAINAVGANSLLIAGYETPWFISSYVSAGVLTNGGKLNSGNALRVCWQVGNSSNYLNFTPPADAVGFKRKFSWHWERFVMLSTQLKLTKTITNAIQSSKVPLIKFGPVTVYAVNGNDAAGQHYRIFANDSEQIGRIDSAQWVSLDIEINREEKKYRVWLANQNIWEVAADYFTTQEFEYVGMLRPPNADSTTLAVHVGLFELDSVVIMDGSGTENNVRTNSLGVRTLAASKFEVGNFPNQSGGDGTIGAINDTVLLNASYDTKYRYATVNKTLDLVSNTTPGEIIPLAVSLGTISRGQDGADAPRVRTAYRQGASGTLKNGKTQLHAGAWRHSRELINQMPDGTVFSLAKLPSFQFGYQVAVQSEFETMVNGAFEYLVFAPPGSDLFSVYRGDADATYIQPGEPEYQIPIPVIPNNGPGPKTLKAGTERLGYFGTVTTAELFNSKSLAERIGLTDGTAVNNSTLWMKFVNAGKVLFIPQKPIRSLISWQSLYQKGLVYGINGPGPSPMPVGSPVNQNVQVNAKGQLFKVRLMTGANSDPAYNTYNVQDPPTSYDSEWSRLIHRVHVNDPTKTYWEKFTDTELGVGSDLTWCQESHPYGAGYRVERGFITTLGLATSIGTTTNAGGYNTMWRPVLEYIGETTPLPEDTVLGPTALKAGNLQLGYYGTLSSSEMLQGAKPAQLIGLTAGTEINPTTDWLKFAYQGKTLFVPKMPLRSGVTWEQIYACGAVYGVDGNGRVPANPAVNQNKIVTIGADKFRVRLFQGADNDPCPTLQYFVNNPTGTQNSEWTQLMQRVWASDPTASYWEKFTDAELGRASGSSSYGVWCQEEHTGWNPNCRVVRNHPGFLGLTTDYINSVGAANLIEAWWPVFELIPRETPNLQLINGTTLPAGTVNTGVTVANNKLTFPSNSYLSIPNDPALSLGTSNFDISFDFTVFSAATVAGQAITSLLYWATWAAPGQPRNYEIFYDHTNQKLYFAGNAVDSSQIATFNVALAANTAYKVSFIRDNNVLYCYINGRKIGQVAFAVDILYSTAQPIMINRRRGGTTGNVYWTASLEIRSLSIRKY